MYLPIWCFILFQNWKRWVKDIVKIQNWLRCQDAIEEVVRIVSTQVGLIELKFNWNTCDCIYIVPSIIAISTLRNCSFFISDDKSSRREITSSAVLSNNADGKFELKSTDNQVENGEENSILYCVLTSGTSSTQKLVKVPPTCIWPNIQDFCQLFDLSEKDTIFSAAPPSFDPFYLDVYVAFLTKSTLLMTSQNMKTIGGESLFR